MEKKDVKNVLKVIKSTELVFANMVMNIVGISLNKDTVQTVINYIS
jgi:hypothetical protein